MNLFNQLNHRYGQSCIEEVRSWEGKEQKLARHKCHLHFNLRCLSQNIVPKGVKLNIKQFSMFQERKINPGNEISLSVCFFVGWSFHYSYKIKNNLIKFIQKVMNTCIKLLRDTFTVFKSTIIGHRRLDGTAMSKVSSTIYILDRKRK